MRPFVLLLVLALPLAGCFGIEVPPEAPVADEVTTAAVEPEPAPPAPAPRGEDPRHHVDRDEPLFAAGKPVVDVGARVPLRGVCEGVCPLASFTVAPAKDALLEVRVAWNGTLTRGFTLEVVGPDGERLPAQRGFDAARVLLPKAPAGAYALRLDGTGTVEGSVSLRDPAAPRGNGTDLLPNLVTLVPSDVQVAACDAWERVEQDAKTCLRLSNAIGNAGDGPLEVRIDLQEGLQTPLAGGRFTQRVHQRDGAPREVPVGEAVFHRTHGHFHYDGIARFALHPVDPLTRVRGETVATHHKAGFCLLDSGEMEGPDAAPERDAARRAEQACLVPTPEGWTMGVSRGRYDLYTSGLTDQYVEITGVQDGLYELVSTANWAGTLHETDPTDNRASVLLALHGGEVEVLEERGFHALPEE